MDIERVASCLLRHTRSLVGKAITCCVSLEGTERPTVSCYCHYWEHNSSCCDSIEFPKSICVGPGHSALGVCASTAGRITLTWPQVTDVTLARAWRHFPSRVANEAYEESKQVSILINLFVGTVRCFEDKCCSWSEIYSNSTPNLLLSLLFWPRTESK